MRIILLICCAIYCFGESLNKDLRVNTWDKLFSIPRKACSTCNFTISFLSKDADINNTNTNNNIDNLTILKNLYEDSDTADYELLDQNTRPLNLNMNSGYDMMNQSAIISKSIFIKSSINDSYKEFLAHKYVFNCMYCGSLDSISNTLPNTTYNISKNGINYAFTPLANAYKIEIGDSLCRVIDSIIFKQEGDSVELWIYSIPSCKK